MRAYEVSYPALKGRASCFHDQTRSPCGRVTVVSVSTGVYSPRTAGTRREFLALALKAFSIPRGFGNCIMWPTIYMRAMAPMEPTYFMRAKGMVKPRTATRASLVMKPIPHMRAIPEMKPMPVMRAKDEVKPMLSMRATAKMKPSVVMRAEAGVHPLALMRATASLGPSSFMRAIRVMKPIGPMRAERRMEPRRVVRATYSMKPKWIMRAGKGGGSYPLPSSLSPPFFHSPAEAPPLRGAGEATAQKGRRRAPTGGKKWRKET